MKTISLLAAWLCICTLSPRAGAQEVAITQIVSHPSLNLVYAGVRSALGDDVSLHYENAQGSIPTAAQIGQRFVGSGVDVIVCISTPSAQAAAAAARKSKTPIVFAAITDPIAAGLIKTLERPGGHITGAMDTQPIEEQVGLIRDMMPEIKSIGVIYNPGEVNSLQTLRAIKEHAGKLNIVEATASTSSMVSASLHKLVHEVDAIYVPLDNTVVSALDTVLGIAKKHDVPVFSADPDLVKRGVLASVGVTYEDVGKLAGEMVKRILEGDNPGDIDARAPDTKRLYVNSEAAERLGIKIPSSILERADAVYAGSP